MAKLSLQFDIHGLPLEVVADHPLLFRMVADELKAFQTKKKPARSDVQLFLSTLPLKPGDTSFSDRLPNYREISKLKTPDTLVKHYGKNLIVVNTHFRKRRIRVAIAPEPFLFPDPAYHFCLTQPLSPWFKEKDFFFLHAGCVAEENQGILIVGPSHAGKSTLTLSAVKAGFKFLSDEQPLLTFKKGSFKAFLFPRRIRLDRSVAAIFSELKPIVQSSTVKQLVFDVEKIWPGCLVSSCKPKILIFPKYQTQGRTLLTRLHSSDALAKLLDDVHFIWYKDGPWNRFSYQHLALFERLVNETKAFELRYRTRDILQIPLIFRKLLHE